MIEIDLPCCGATTHVMQLDDDVHCEECGVTLELADESHTALPLAA